MGIGPDGFQELVDQVRNYSTIWGQLWFVLVFVFRGMVVAVIGSQVYSDDQSGFTCDTKQPGCKQVCFNRFMPIGQLRFWSFQLLFVSAPAIIFSFFATTQTSHYKKLEKLNNRRCEQTGKPQDLDLNDQIKRARRKLGNFKLVDKDDSSEIIWTTRVRDGC